jgi:hypothetical protein
MKKVILIVLLTLFVLLMGFSPMPAAAGSSQEEKNIEVVKKILEVIETKEHMLLYDLMDEPRAKQAVKNLGYWWRKYAEVKAEIHDIFASGNNVAVRWTLNGKKDRHLEEDWQVDYIFIFRLDNEKVVGVWAGDNYWQELMKHGFTIKSPPPKTFEGRLRATMGDMHTIGRAIKSYMQDLGHAPKAASIKELKRIIQPFYIKTLPLTDAWENELLYKVDPKNPKNYWIGSSGSDGKFEGFDQEGTWKFEEGEKGQDIVLANGDFTYMPNLKEKKEK